MGSLELLNKYPLSKEVVKDWFMKSMIESFKDESVPEEFKQMLLNQGVGDDKVATLIDVNARVLFDVFDENEISINIERTPNRIEEWAWNIMQHGQDNGACISRKEAERKAIEYAFGVLEQQLSGNNEQIISDESENQLSLFSSNETNNENK